MENKTAIEWLHEIAKQREPDKFDWEQAKQMEKEQSEKIRTNTLLNSKCKYCGGEDKGQ